MSFCHGADGRQSDAGTAGAVRTLSECVEQARQELAVDARPVVFDSEHELARRLTRELDLDDAARMPDGVVEQIVERLPQALRVDHRRHRDRRRLQQDARVPTARLCRDDGLGHERAHVRRRALDMQRERVRAPERQQVIDHYCQTRHLVLDRLQLRGARM
jgi:hypothetical protein